jgi:hypothetical protein
MLYSDAGGDGQWCITGKKVYCVRAEYEWSAELPYLCPSSFYYSVTLRVSAVSD